MTVSWGAARHVALLLAALTLSLSGCSAPAGPAAPAATAESSAGADPAVAALDFRAATLDGSLFDATTLSGTPVVLWFWAPWCTICRAEAPDVAAVAAEYAGRAMFLGVPGLGEVADMREFVADTGLAGLTHVVDADGSLWQRFGVVSQPAYVFVGADGGLVVAGRVWGVVRAGVAVVHDRPVPRWAGTPTRSRSRSPAPAYEPAHRLQP